MDGHIHIPLSCNNFSSRSVIRCLWFLTKYLQNQCNQLCFVFSAN